MRKIAGRAENPTVSEVVRALPPAKGERSRKIQMRLAWGLGLRNMHTTGATPTFLKSRAAVRKLTTILH